MKPEFIEALGLARDQIAGARLELDGHERILRALVARGETPATADMHEALEMAAEWMRLMADWHTEAGSKLTILQALHRQAIDQMPRAVDN